MDNIKHDLSIVSPDVASNGKQIVIQGELVEYDPVARRSGKFVRLGMTAADAMRLLALLKGVQKQLGLPDEPGIVESVLVPAKRDQN